MLVFSTYMGNDFVLKSDFQLHPKRITVSDIIDFWIARAFQLRQSLFYFAGRLFFFLNIFDSENESDFQIIKF